MKYFLTSQVYPLVLIIDLVFYYNRNDPWGMINTEIIELAISYLLFLFCTWPLLTLLIIALREFDTRLNGFITKYFILVFSMFSCIIFMVVILAAMYPAEFGIGEFFHHILIGLIAGVGSSIMYIGITRKSNSFGPI